MVGAFIAVLIFRALWMFTILAGTAYVVFGLGWLSWIVTKASGVSLPKFLEARWRALDRLRSRICLFSTSSLLSIS